MAFIFSMRSTVNGSMHRRENTSTTTSSLPAIAEDGTSILSRHDTPPVVPARAANRPGANRFGLRAHPVLFGDDFGPPAYAQFETTIEGPDGEKLMDVRKGFNNNKHIAKRGGWKRLLIVLAVILCIIALIVGLAVGLRKKNKNSSNDTDSGEGSGSSSGSTPAGGASGTIGGPTGNPAPNTTFPAGSYRIDTYLSTVATDCTSNPATWLCYPYSTYAQDTSASEASYDWIVTPVNGTDNYTISSTPNIFSITFANVSMSLLNEGTDQEHYFFQTSMQKPTKPSSQLGDQNVASTCYFNGTTFHAYLYTKMAKTYPNNSTVTNSTDPFTAWPYAVKIEQVAASGAGSPDCVDPSGKSVGDFSVEDQGQLCDCLYLNTGT